MTAFISVHKDVKQAICTLGTLGYVRAECLLASKVNWSP